MLRVLLVKAKPYRWLDQDSYEGFFQTISKSIHSFYGDQIEIIIVEEYDHLERVIKSTKPRPYAVILISAQRSALIEKLAEEYPKIKFIVLTGELPEGKVIFIDKGWMADKLTVAKIIDIIPEKNRQH